MNTFEFKKAVEFLLKEAEDDNSTNTLNFKKTKSDEGDEQIVIEILGTGFYTDSYLILSKTEAAALLDLAKEFSGNRSHTIKKSVNTDDKYRTQSTISIQPQKNLEMVIARQEGSIYKGYQTSDAGGYLKTKSAAVYQLVDELPKYI